jgi:hypothetical protein
LIDIVLVVDRAVSNDGRTFAWGVVRGDDTRIALWGFGLAFVPNDGLPLLRRRYDPTPLVLREIDGLERVRSQQALPPATHVETTPVWWSVTRACWWIAGYEAWLARAASPSWRPACLKSWRRSSDDDREPEQAWSQLADALERAILEQTTRIGTMRDDSPPTPRSSTQSDYVSDRRVRA